MTNNSWTLQRALPYILIIGGIIAYICAFILTQDKFKVLENPNFIPSCNLNPIISCGGVMQSKQAAIFGFPNPLIGLGAYPSLIVVGAAMLAGARFKRWFWLALNAGMALGTAFALWLLFESIYRIHALCPFCLGTDAVTLPMFWYITLYNVDRKNIRLPKGGAQRVYGWVRRHHLDLLVLFYLIIIGLILNHFWYYYGRNF